MSALTVAVGIGQQVHAARKARGLSVARLARLARTSQHTVIALERGLVPARFETLARLGAVLGFDERELFELWWAARRAEDLTSQVALEYDDKGRDA